MEQYLNLAIGAPRRLALLRKSATSEKWVRPMTWRDVRFARLNSGPVVWAFEDKGEHGWVSHDGPLFGREWYCDETPDGPRIDHTGWFCDDYQDSKLRGIVAYLGGSRWLAGYENSDSGERVYFAAIHDCVRDAAYAADSEAEQAAGEERESRELEQREQDEREAEQENVEAGYWASRDVITEGE